MPVFNTRAKGKARRQPWLCYSLTLLCVAAGVLLLSSPPHALHLPGSAASGGGSSTSFAERWPGAANTSVAIQLPGWVGCPAPPCQYSGLTDGDVDATSVAWTSCFGEDAWLFHNLFYNKRNGFFLEFGAMDGITFSNSNFLTKAAGWRGMLIEACPSQYQQLKTNRKEAICVHAAVCRDFQTVHWHSAGAVGGIFEFMAQGFKDTFHPNLNGNQLPEIPCVPLMFLLEKFGIDWIDLWSLDVEGGELEVLQSVDFSKLRVGVLIVETDSHNKTKDAAVVDLLTNVGFEVVPKGPVFNELQKMNTVLIHKSYKSQLRRAPNVTVVQT